MKFINKLKYKFKHKKNTIKEIKSDIGGIQKALIDLIKINQDTLWEVLQIKDVVERLENNNVKN